MIFDWIFIIAGLAALIAGAEVLVRGASGIALLAKLTPAVVGLTVVAVGTSMPELMVSAKASLSGNAGLAMGNAVGSSILNIGLVLGITSLIRPLEIQGNTMRFEWPILLLATLVFVLLVRDGILDRIEGGFLFTAMLVFMFYTVWLSRQGVVSKQLESLSTASYGRSGAAALMLNLLAIIIGAALLSLGANILVRGAISIAGSLGISQTVIGLTIVAIGTSAPELFTSAVAALRGHGDLAVGNIIGSNIFNIMAILGVSSILRPMAVPQELLQRDLWWLTGITVLMFPLMLTGKKVARIEGLVLSIVFVSYVVVLVIGA